MKTWNIGNTTVRNPQRLREALQKEEIVNLEKRFVELANLLGESAALPVQPAEVTISDCCFRN